PAAFSPNAPPPTAVHTLSLHDALPILLPCAPTGNDDLGCLAEFTKSFGRRALHRPITDEEVVELTNLHMLARQRGDFTQSVSLVDRKSTRLNSSHVAISYAVFFLKKKT